MARCLAGESSPEDDLKLRLLLSEDKELEADYETLKFLMFNNCENNINDVDLKNKFNRISRKLEDEGLM